MNMPDPQWTDHPRRLRLPVNWKRLRASTWEFLKTLVVAFLLAQVIMVSVAQAFQVEQYSMEPTLLPRDRVLVNKFVYRFHPPHRGDVVVFRYPLNPSRNYIKRVIGLPGERVDVRGGRVEINGQPLPESYLPQPPSGDYGPKTVPAGSVFVMGDNRDNSEDSRSFGPLPARNIIGQAVLVYWPLQRLRILR